MKLTVKVSTAGISRTSSAVQMATILLQRERERARESESVNLDGSQRFNKAEREREIWKCEREDRDGTV